ncbi:hypothetical protein C8F04DRAFT_1105404 [Mycena alexandri]|uniref:Uncharacterized protein n=1 Tax=Mycena alexandri TaxID=1745969 RepID=A0AAD6SSB9_9AGAR|nr:hypothetical protein C8F04DRAFT_1105404 [Mycena alexandri]
MRIQTMVTVQAGTTFRTMDGFGFSEAFGHANDLFNSSYVRSRTWMVAYLYRCYNGAAAAAITFNVPASRFTTTQVQAFVSTQGQTSRRW